ncbi:MAG: Asp-tRNA(Asn)/Glu-tRNA(Gln) amidotransferase GatCAB subunit A [Pseudonocardiales bacterium]|nr:MAG: Asp-tRNA(Asn)/Glu-tRNA(Gln) amidotransferase GatCAB subunit A [Pseudonocardiales bacterium]
MTITKPTATDIATLATRLGYHSAVGGADQYAAIIGNLLDAYDTVDTVDGIDGIDGSLGADAVVATGEPRPHRGPDPGEDPHNAWYVKTSIISATAGPLAGRTVALKDSIMLAGVPMMNGSGLLEGYRPEFDATVVTRVLDAGAEITGKTNCEYFCLSGGSHTGADGPTHNPHRRGYSAGGSSSGSAVAVATGDVDMALGADQAGSIRVPASYSGVVGLKPTYGLVPYTGIAPLDPMLDHVGPMTATVADNALLLSVIAGPDGFDPRQQPAKTVDYQAALAGGARGLRIGVLAEGFGQDGGQPDVDTAVRRAAADLHKLGADVIDVSIPMHSIGSALWMPIIMQGMARTVVHGQGFGVGRDDRYPTVMMDHLFAQRHRVDELPANIKLCVLMAEYVTERHGQTHYGRAVNGIRRLRAAYDTALRDVDVLVMPTTPQKAQPLPDEAASIAVWCARATEMFGNTAAFDVTHHPALSLPCGNGDGLPIGMMIVGRHFDEECVYRAAFAYEQRDNQR